MTDTEITELKKEVAQLRAELAELRECAFNHFDAFTTHICEQHQEIGDLFSYVMPIVRKLYPGYVATKKQFDQALARKPSPFSRNGDAQKES